MYRDKQQFTYRKPTGKRGKLPYDSKKAAEQDVKVAIGSDAHICFDVGNFDTALSIVKQANIKTDNILNTSMEEVIRFLESKGRKIIPDLKQKPKYKFYMGGSVSVMVIYLNGQRVDYENAKVSVEDRGFQFGDGIYEVVRVYEGRVFYLNRHLERLKNGAREIYLDLDFGIDTLEKTCRQAVKESGFDNASVYIQVTRGTAPRKHVFPEKSSCNWVVIVKEEKGIPDEAYKNGVMAITIPDERWSRCNIKTIQLLANCIAKQKGEKGKCL